MPDVKAPSFEVLHKSLFVQLLPDDDNQMANITYARPFTPGLVQALVVSTPDTYVIQTDEDVAGYPLNIDEAFAIGRKNTDAQPVASVTDLGVSGIHQAQGGASNFTAALLSNPAQFCSDFELPGEKGLLFLPLHRNNIFYAEPDGNKQQVDQFFEISRQGWDAIANDAGALTNDVFLWLPVGSITRVRDNAKTYLADPPTPAPPSDAATSSPPAPPAIETAPPAPLAPELSQQQLDIEARYGADPKERAKLALNSDDVKTLKDLALDDVGSVRYSAVMNRTTPRRSLETLVDDELEWISAVAQARLATTYDAFESLIESPHWTARDALARNPNCPLEILVRLCRDEDYTVRSNAAENKQIPPEVLERLSLDVNPFVRLAVASHPNTPVAALAKLSTDAGAMDDDDDMSLRIRKQVARNPNTPQYVLERLSQDECLEVREAAQQSLDASPGFPALK